MKRWVLPLAGVAVIARLLGTERMADMIRWADQRLELFSPRGAGLYARVAPRILAPLYRAVADDVVAAQAEHVLDVGTGPGELAIAIARRCPDCQVTGVDLAPEMLATAGGRAESAGVADRVGFLIADAAALPIGDGSIHVVVSTLSLHHWRDPPAILREVHRVLRPGGQALIYDLRFSYSPRQFAAFADATPFGSAALSYATLRGGFPVAVYARYALRKAGLPESVAA